MYDIAINYGTVLDTEQKVRIRRNVGITGNRIAALSEDPLDGTLVIDASGLIVSPGFIDVHGHVDGYEYSGILSARQGITTTVGGNCGLSPLKLDSFFRKESKSGFPVNQAELAGHSFTLRRAAGIMDPYQAADPSQIDAMCRMAGQMLSQGAVGISLGLDYSPGASLREILALARVCASYGAIMPVHTRLFTQNDLNSLYEILYIGKMAGVRLLFSHFVYQYGTGTMDDALAIIDHARQIGMDVYIDSGMYTNWSTYIDTATFDEQTIIDNAMSFQDMVVATGPHRGKRLNRELYLYLRENCPGESVIFMEQCDCDVYKALSRPYAMPSTDIGAYQKGEGHPQIAGTFPRYLRRMVNMRGDLTLEEAVYKATLLPARIFGFTGKGILRPGMDADLVLFEPERIEDMAKYPDEGAPDAPPVGIPHVIVNGVPVVKDGLPTRSRPGRILKAGMRPAKRACCISAP